MNKVYANYSVSVSELKKNPSAVLKDSGGESVAILNHNKPTAYLIPADLYGILMEMAEDYGLAEIVKERQEEKEESIKVSIDEI
ncbi:type II toxin-antitoxin system Phd/YefM family antitoxin [bacterium]|nr:type II toxin-antitoxin system Phd/YefM family antitoxin [bacterium]